MRTSAPVWPEPAVILYPPNEPTYERLLIYINKPQISTEGLHIKLGLLEENIRTKFPTANIITSQTCEKSILPLQIVIEASGDNRFPRYEIIPELRTIITSTLDVECGLQPTMPERIKL